MRSPTGSTSCRSLPDVSVPVEAVSAGLAGAAIASLQRSQKVSLAATSRQSSRCRSWAAVAPRAMAFACQTLLPEPATASPELKSRAAQSIFEMVSQSEFEVARMGFLAECAGYMRLPLASLQRDFAAFAHPTRRRPFGSAALPASSSPWFTAGGGRCCCAASGWAAKGNSESPGSKRAATADPHAPTACSTPVELDRTGGRG